MPPKQNAPTRKGEGVECRLARDIDVDSTALARRQYLAARLGLSSLRCALIASIAFDGGAHG